MLYKIQNIDFPTKILYSNPHKFWIIQSNFLTSIKYITLIPIKLKKQNINT